MRMRPRTARGRHSAGRHTRRAVAGVQSPLRPCPEPAMHRACLPLLLCLFAVDAVAQTAPVREHLAPSGWEGSYHDLHYTPVVRIGDRVIVSGIPALEGDTEEAKIRWA